MKKYTSVFSLIVRSSIYPVLGILAGCSIGTFLLFALTGVDSLTLRRGLDDARLIAILAQQIVLISVILCRSLCDKSGKLVYTLNRLAISEKQIFILQAIYHLLVYWMVFTAQGLVAFGLSQWYCHANPQNVNQLTLFITSYQFNQLHLLFPMEDLYTLLTNVVLSLGLAISTAAYPLRHRHNSSSITTYLMVALALFCLWVDQDLGNQGGMLVLSAGGTFLCIFSAIAGIVSMEVDDGV